MGRIESVTQEQTEARATADPATSSSYASSSEYASRLHGGDEAVTADDQRSLLARTAPAAGWVLIVRRIRGHQSRRVAGKQLLHVDHFGRYNIVNERDLIEAGQRLGDYIKRQSSKRQPTA